MPARSGSLRRMAMTSKSPLFQNKHYRKDAVFRPQNLLRETRRQKSLPAGKVPPVCVLDPDGDMVRYLVRNQLAKRNPAWACYHTELYQFRRNGQTFGIIGCAVGGPFAVLLAEQLFVSSCRLLVSVTSAGQILPVRPPPYFVLIERALRDEGTSYHYLPPARYARLGRALGLALRRCLKTFTPPVERGSVCRPPMRPTGKPRRPLPPRVARASWRWRWKRRRFTPSPRRSASRSFASRISRTGWAWWRATLRKARRTALWSRCA